MNPDIWFSIRLSLQVAGIATVTLLLLAIPLAWVFSRRSFRGKRLCEALFMLPLILPPTVLGYYLVVLLGKHGLIGRVLYSLTGWTPVFSWWGAVIASVVVAFPLLFQSASSALSSVDSALEDTAHTLGVSRLDTFRRVTLPLAARGILAGVALTFARAMGEFGATMMLAGNIPGRTSTAPLAIYNAFVTGNSHQTNLLVLVYSGLSVTILLITSMTKVCKNSLRG